MNRPPQIIGVSITVRVTVASGRLASGPKNVALSKPASANTAARVMSSGPYAESDGGTVACWPPAPVTIIRPAMNSNEHDSTARIARAANRTPRTRQPRITIAIPAYTRRRSVGPRNSTPKKPSVAITAWPP